MDGVRVLARTFPVGAYHEEAIDAIVNSARDVVTYCPIR